MIHLFIWQAPWQASSMRLYGTAPPQGNPAPPLIKITPNLSLQKATLPEGEQSKQRPLVLVLSWLLAKQRHLDNFIKFYTNRGCDVLTVRIQPLQVPGFFVPSLELSTTPTIVQQLHWLPIHERIFKLLTININV